MATNTTKNAIVYIHVIEDVVNNVREEFINNGGHGESVLSELQGIWETKVMEVLSPNGPMESGTAEGPAPGGPLTHDLNVPYDGVDEYENHTVDMLFPLTPLLTPLPTLIPGTAGNPSMYNIPTGSSDYPTPASENGSNVVSKGRISPSMPPPSPRIDVSVAYMNSRDGAERGNSNQQFTQDLFVPYSGKRKLDEYSAQYQNFGHNMPKGTLEDDALRLTNVGNRKLPGNFIFSSSKFPQVDGPMPDLYDEVLSTPNEGANDEFNEARSPAVYDTQTNTPITAHNHINEDEDDELLNEDDDEELNDLENNEDTNSEDLILAQFNKVSRKKGRWRCTLKAGFMHINGRDVMFDEATGEFDF